MNFPDFKITSQGQISKEFTKRDIHSFKDAFDFIKHLQYRRNTNKEELITVFNDNCGTCGTKHALLKKLADENGFEGIELVLGMYKMNKTNSPKVSGTLSKNNIDYIPEAHNYLRFQKKILDCTNSGSQASDFIDDLLEEVIIQPEQITGFKVLFHKRYLQNWLLENKDLSYSLDEIWVIREQCIKDLSAKR